MKKTIVRLLSLICLAIFSVSFVAAQTVTLSFTGQDSENHFIPMNYVYVENETKAWQDTLVYPDTVLLLTTSGISDFEGSGEFRLSQNVPNPFDGETAFSLQMPQQGSVQIEVFDLTGRKITAYNNTLPKGIHTFKVLLSAPQSCLLSVRSGREVATLKMLNNGRAGENAIRYMGEGMPYTLNMQLKNGAKGASERKFDLGDVMSYKGCVIVKGKEYFSQTVKQEQRESEQFILSFELPKLTLPEVKTSAVTNVGPTSAVCGGKVLSDGGSAITACGVCWSTKDEPTLEDHFTVDTCQEGTFISLMDSLTSMTTYFVRAYATNELGTSYGNEYCFTTASMVDVKPCEKAPTVKDYDGNEYATVQIGKQCWMQENLRVSHYNNGKEIPLATETSASKACRYIPNNNSENVNKFGYLYNWPAVVMEGEGSSANPSGVEGICPTGWHMPSQDEWTQLTLYVGSHKEYICGNNERNIAKALAAKTDFFEYTEECTVGSNPIFNNATGFTALPAGFFNGRYYNFNFGAFFWSTSVRDTNSVYCANINYDIETLCNLFYKKDCAVSVRCLLNSEEVEVVKPTVITSEATEITESSVKCGGVVLSDGGDNVIARGVCWSDNEYSFPTIDGQHSVDGAGTGEFVSSLEELSAGTKYVVRAYATNNMGTAYGQLMYFTTAAADGKSCPGTATVQDADGNSYQTILIGEQCWMRENLRTTHYTDGSSIELGSGKSVTEPYYYHADNNAENDEEYGLLYNWPAVMKGETASAANPSGVQGICPEGWHVPSDAEWKQLTTYLNTVDLYRCSGLTEYLAKSIASTTGWKSSKVSCAVGNNQQDNNATGFSVMPAGNFFAHAELFGEDASLWSTTEKDNNSVWYHDISYAGIGVNVFYDDKYAGFSVRCLKD